jgi:hypothetical protein
LDAGSVTGLARRNLEPLATYARSQTFAGPPYLQEDGVVVDAPFTESKEIVSGCFYLDCATREEAIAIAGECPAVEWATVEMREIGPCWEGA